MPPKSRKRRASINPPTPPAKKVARAKSNRTDPEANIIGGMKGDYRVTGTEVSKEFTSFTVTGENEKEIPCQSRDNTKNSSNPRLIFTHGAGGGIENPATKVFAEGYATEAPVTCFQGTMNLQSRVKSFEAVVDHVRERKEGEVIAVGGRSMGARAAVLTAHSHKEITKLVLVSYPLVGPQGDVRDKILLDLSEDKEVLFVIGSRDSMCELGRLNKVREKMKAKTILLVVDGADHGMGLGSGTLVKGKDKSKVVEHLRKLSGKMAAEWAIDSSKLKDGEIIGAGSDQGQSRLDAWTGKKCGA